MEMKKNKKKSREVCVLIFTQGAVHVHRDRVFCGNVDLTYTARLFLIIKSKSSFPCGPVLSASHWPAAREVLTKPSILSSRSFLFLLILPSCALALRLWNHSLHWKGRTNAPLYYVYGLLETFGPIALVPSSTHPLNLLYTLSRRTHTRRLLLFFFSLDWTPCLVISRRDYSWMVAGYFLSLLFRSHPFEDILLLLSLLLFFPQPLPLGNGQAGEEPGGRTNQKPIK